MKKLLIIATSLAFATAAVRADIATYQSTVNSQSPTYYFNFDNSLGANVGSGTFAGNGTTGFATDLSGNANGALSVGSSSSGYTLSTPNIISGSGSTVSSGSFSFLFKLSTVGGTSYFFSDSDNTSGTAGASGAAASALALDFSSGTFQFKVGNHSFSSATYLPAPTASTWYYFATTWNFNGATPTSDSVSWYIGSVGGTLVAGNNTLVPYTAFSSTTEVGDGGTLTLGNRRQLNSSPQGNFDELATWGTALTSGQIQAQFDALQPIPEPSTCALLGIGGLFVLFARRKLSGICLPAK
jgi:hypothetical protein